MKALAALERAVASPPTEERDFAGIVKSFEFTYETGWKYLRDLVMRSGHEAGSARETFRVAAQIGLIPADQVWLDMILDRNLTVHTYNLDFASALCERVRDRYVAEFQSLLEIQI